jgi:hypothetical protein
MATNIETTKHTVIMSLVTDIVLLVTMLLGLFRMCVRLGGRFGLGDFLWKQVGGNSPPSLSYPTFSNALFTCEGVIWLLLATVAEVPPTVRLSISFCYDTIHANLPS